MKAVWRAFMVGVHVVGAGIAVATPPAQAQGFNATRSLGGYGATASDSMASIGASSSFIPYAGNFGGFMPYRMGGGSSLSFSTRGTSTMEPSRTSFSLPSMSGGMTSMSGAIGKDSGARTRGFSSFGAQGGMGFDDRMRQQMPSGMSVMPPSFGYPFYQPPSLLSPSSSTGGMSM
jgi:hypothetical protein